MTSTTATTNPTSSTAPQSFAAPKSGSPLASLANATEPPSSSYNQQQLSPVATFPQRTSGGSPTANKASPFGASFGSTQMFTPTTTLQFAESSSTNASAMPFPNFSAGNIPSFSFNNASLGNPPPPRFSFNTVSPANSSPYIFNSPTNNPQSQQPLPSPTMTSPIQKHEISNNKLQTSFSPANNRQQIPSTNETRPNNMPMSSKQSSDPATSTARQSKQPDQDQEETDTPASLAACSLVAKKLTTQLRDPDNQVMDRSDPASPLFSSKTFEELNLKPELLKGMYNMNFRLPSKIQEIALPNLLGNPPRNIIAQSQSGTGKTAAFSIATITRIDPSIQSAQALILTPTFELAMQIGSVIERIAQFLPYIQIAYAVRDPSASKKDQRVRGQLITEPIVVGTPGTVEDWWKQRKILNINKLLMFVVDEADIMIATQNFQAKCMDLVKGLDRSRCQMMLFSATYSDEVMTFAREIISNPVVMRLKREKQTLTNIRQFYVSCQNSEEKCHAIEHIYAQLTIGQAMIFCRKKDTANDLAIRLANQGYSVRLLTGALDIEQRAAIIQQFREGIFRVMISTNVTSRGIDIDDVSLVVNYDMPTTVTLEPDYETYLHRIGRCGRFGKKGFTFNLIDSEKDFKVMKAIEDYFSHPIEKITMEGISQLQQE